MKEKILVEQEFMMILCIVIIMSSVFMSVLMLFTISDNIKKVVEQNAKLIEQIETIKVIK